MLHIRNAQSMAIESRSAHPFLLTVVVGAAALLLAALATAQAGAALAQQGQPIPELMTVAALVAVTHAIAFRERSAEPARPAPPPEPVFAARGAAGHHLIHARDVETIEAQGNYARLSTAQGRFMVRETFAGIERRLPPGFRRVHRSHIVNVDLVARLEPLQHGRYRIHLASGASLVSSRSFARTVRALALKGRCSSSPNRPR